MEQLSIIDNTPTPAPLLGGYSPLFEVWWQAYPRKISKHHASQLWAKAANQHGAEQMLKAASNYATYVADEGTDKKYVKHPTTFLNDTRRPYLDYFADPQADLERAAWAEMETLIKGGEWRTPDRNHFTSDKAYNAAVECLGIQIGLLRPADAEKAYRQAYNMAFDFVVERNEPETLSHIEAVPTPEPADPEEDPRLAMQQARQALQRRAS